jgi:twitching motility two-component system response regulator PilG
MSEVTYQLDKEMSGVLDYLQTVTPLSEVWGIEVAKNHSSGTLYFKGRDIIAAQYGPLLGNGALLTIAGWRNPKIRRVAAKRDVRENTTLSLADIRHELSSHPHLAENGAFDEIACLKQAILMVYQFQFKQAGAKLAEILRFNKYNYIAWLWYSRIVGKTESILKTLSEAQKWGNADREILLENQRNQKLLLTAPPTVKRCPFCWTVLVDDPFYCGNCRSLLTIRQGHAGESAHHAQLDTAVARYLRVHTLDPKNVQVAYCLALGYFNLGRIEQSLSFLRIAEQHAPGVQLYRQAIDTLESLGRKDPPDRRAPVQAKTPVETKTPDQVKTPVKAASPPKASQKSILVIEDSQTSRKVISMILAREGYHIIEASTGLDGVRAARGTTPSLILLDVMLPDMTGYDVLPRLKEMPHLKEVPAIMLTGKTGSADRVLGMRAGSSEYLTKPFNPQKLIETIKKYL